MTRNSFWVAFPLAVGIALAGCATSPKEDSKLEDAQAQLDALKADNAVRTHAPAPLLDAEQALKRAESAHENRDKEGRDHQYYLAQRYMETAQAVTESNVVMQETEALHAERERLTIAARESQITQQRSELEQAEARAKELEAEMAALEAKPTERGLVVTMDELFFETAGTNIAAGADRSLDTVAAFLENNPDQRVLIEGHTDATGNDEYNQQLSKHRAEVVKREIVARGIEADRLVARGFGEGRPVASNATTAGRQLNRRVEIIFPNNKASAGG